MRGYIEPEPEDEGPVCPHCGSIGCMGTDDDNPGQFRCFVTDKPMPQSYIDALDQVK